MAPMPKLQLQALAEIDAAYEADRTPRHGYRLPPSKLGEACERRLWYSFRWASPPPSFDGRLLRLFQTGDIHEERFVEDLRRIGCEVVDRDLDDPEKQIGVSFAYGHAYGYLDAEILNLPDAPKTWHVGEFKSHNAKSFRHLVDNGVEASKPEHYAQTLIYMHLRHRERGVYLAVNKDTDERYGERIEYDFDKAARLERKAERIVMAQNPPARISSKPDAFGCRFCDHADKCHGDAFAEVNCRTCLHVTPGDSGRWICERHNSERNREEQVAGCADHLFIPSLVPGDQVDADGEIGRVSYAMPDGRTFHNVRQSSGGNYYD